MLFKSKRQLNKVLTHPACLKNNKSLKTMKLPHSDLTFLVLTEIQILLLNEFVRFMNIWDQYQIICFQKNSNMFPN